MKNGKVQIGIIGCGGIANGKHMPSLKKLSNVEMVAFCDIVVERAHKAKADYGTPDAKVYENYKELIADPEIDVVHVCTPNRAHSFITVDALEAGKHVMCEKPMAINSRTLRSHSPLTSLCTKFKSLFCAHRQSQKKFAIPLAIFRILRYYILVILCQSVSIRALMRKFQNHGGTPT